MKVCAQLGPFIPPVRTIMAADPVSRRAKYSNPNPAADVYTISHRPWAAHPVSHSSKNGRSRIPPDSTVGPHEALNCF